MTTLATTLATVLLILMLMASQTKATPAMDCGGKRSATPLWQGTTASTAPATTGEYVVLLHGLARSSFSMLGIERYLTRRGYHVINARYSTARLSVREISDQILDPLLKTQIPAGARVNFVTHSQGGIIVRQYLSNHELPNLGRVVMLAPPNHGSELGDLLRKNPLTHAMLGPGYLELGTDRDSAPNRLGPIDFDCGVIAGDRSFNPLFSALLPGPDDGKVTVASAKMDGLADFLVLHTSHTWMVWRSATMNQVLSFLESGRFSRTI